MNVRMIAGSILAFALLLMLVACGGAARQTAQKQTTETASTSPLPPNIAVSISPAVVTLGASETQQFAASMSNGSNTDFTWSLECTAADCGTVSAQGFYSAPAVIANAEIVWVSATPQSDKSIRGTASVRYMPLAVELSPQVAEMSAGATQSFTASVSRHSNHDVTWSLSGLGCTGEACGTLTNASTSSAIYTAPAIVAKASTALVTATSVADKTKSQTIRISLMPVTAALNGRYAFLFRTSDSATVFAASLVADGSGELAGSGDLINADGLHANQSFTGTYTLGSDGRGTMEITGAGATLKFRMMMQSGNFGRLLDFCGNSDGNGWLERQNESAFSSSAFAGKYAYLLAGKRTEGPVSHVGWVAFDSDCRLVNSYNLMNDPLSKHLLPGESLGWGSIDAGYCTVDANTGRGTVVATERWLMTLPDVIFYMVDANRAVVVGDANAGSLRLSGTMERIRKTQYAADDFRGDFTYYAVSDAGVAAGRITASAGPDEATARLSAGIEDRVEDSKVTLDSAVTGAISNSWCYPDCWYGNSDFSMTISTARRPATETYMVPVSPAKLYFIGYGYYGEADLQEGGPFSGSMFSGKYSLQLFGRDAHAVGVTTMAPPEFAGKSDVSNSGLMPDASTQGTISFVSGDRANVSLTTAATGMLSFRAYPISGDKLLLISIVPGQVTMGWAERVE